MARHSEAWYLLAFGWKKNSIYERNLRATSLLTLSNIQTHTGETRTLMKSFVPWSLKFDPANTEAKKQTSMMRKVIINREVHPRLRPHLYGRCFCVCVCLCVCSLLLCCGLACLFYMVSHLSLSSLNLLMGKNKYTSNCFLAFYVVCCYSLLSVNWRTSTNQDPSIFIPYSRAIK